MTTSDAKKDPRHWREEVAFEVWRHHASTGGADKDRMIQIATMLLGFSAALAAFTLREAGRPNLVGEHVVPRCLAIVGLITSFASACVTLVYGGYANWNWAKADQIARDYEWWRLYPGDSPIAALGGPPKGFTLVGWALNQAKPRPAHTDLAPVFWYFFWFSVASFGVHLSLLALFLS
jgi:hypothetical protein